MCFSAIHTLFSRIDYFLLSCGLKECTKPIVSLPSTLADNPLALGIDLSFKIKRSQRWLFNTFLLNDTTFNSKFRTGISTFYIDDNKGSVADARLVWMATEGFIQEFTISRMSHLKKVRTLRVVELEEKCLCLEKTQREKFEHNLR